MNPLNERRYSVERILAEELSKENWEKENDDSESSSVNKVANSIPKKVGFEIYYGLKLTFAVAIITLNVLAIQDSLSNYALGFANLGLFISARLLNMDFARKKFQVEESLTHHIFGKDCINAHSQNVAEEVRVIAALISDIVLAVILIINVWGASDAMNPITLGSCTLGLFTASILLPTFYKAYRLCVNQSQRQSHLKA